MIIRDHFSEGATRAADMISLGVVLGTLSDILPSVAALFTILWTAIRIWETRTVQGWLGRSRPDPADPTD